MTHEGRYDPRRKVRPAVASATYPGRWVQLRGNASHEGKCDATKDAATQVRRSDL